MSIIWILIAIVAALVVLALLYWSLLSSVCSGPERADEIHGVMTEDLWKIRLYRYKPAGGKGEPVLLCHGLFANHRNFTEPEGTSLVDVLTDRGYDCWVIDLRGCRSSLPPFGRNRTEPKMDDYLAGDLPAAVDYVRKATGYAKVHWIGHSMGGMLLYAYEEAYGNEKLASGATIGSPPGFQGVSVRRPGLLLHFASLFPGAAGWIMRGSAPFARTCPVHAKLMPTNWQNLNPSVCSCTMFNVLEAPIPQVAEKMGDALAYNTLILKDKDGKEVDVFGKLDDLETPLLVFYGAQDPFVSIDNGRAFFDKLPNKDKKLVILSEETGCVANYSHIDLVFGREAKTEVYDPIVDWIGGHPVKDRIDPETGEVTRTTSRKKTAAGKKTAAKKKSTAKKKTVSKKKSTAKKKTASKKKATAKKKTTAKKKSAAKKKSSTGGTPGGTG